MLSKKVCWACIHVKPSCWSSAASQQCATGCSGAGLLNLSYLDLSQCNLTGTLPPGWGAGWQSLQTLKLGLNGLSGSLPPGWGSSSLASLQMLMLANNTFTGAMPDSWSSPSTFTHLQALDLSHNSLTGQLSAAWAAPGAFPNLTSLLLSDNSLQGSLPVEWGQAAALQNLSLLTLQDNQLSGGVPAAWQLTKQVGTAFLGRGQSSQCLPARQLAIAWLRLPLQPFHSRTALTCTCQMLLLPCSENEDCVSAVSYVIWLQAVQKVLLPGNTGMCEPVRARLQGFLAASSQAASTSSTSSLVQIGCLEAGCSWQSMTSALNASVRGEFEGCAISMNATGQLAAGPGCTLPAGESERMLDGPVCSSMLPS